MNHACTDYAIVVVALGILGSMFLIIHRLFPLLAKRESICAVLIILGVLFVVYFSVVTGCFVFHDDYGFFDWQKNDWQTHRQYTFFNHIGRPLSNAVYLSLGMMIHDLKDANYARALVIVIVGFIGFEVYIFLRHIGWLSARALCMALLVVTLPSFQIYVSWLSTASNAVSVLFAGWAYLIVSAMKNSARSSRGRCGMMLAALFFLLLAFNIYQPGAQFFITLFAFEFLCREKLSPRSYQKFLMMPLLLYGATILLYFIEFKALIGSLDVIHRFVPEMYRGNIVAHLGNKVRWFFACPLRDSLNLWCVYPRREYTLLVIGVIGCGLGIEYIKRRVQAHVPRGEILKALGLKYGIVCVLLCLCYGIHLVNRYNMASYRSTVALTPVIVMLFWQGIERLFLRERIHLRVMYVCVCIALCIAQYNVTAYIVFPNTIEIADIMHQIKLQQNKYINEFYLYMSKDECQGARYDEFCMLSSAYRQNLEGIIKCALYEQDIHTQQNIVITAYWMKEDNTRIKKYTNRVIVELRPVQKALCDLCTRRRLRE